MIYWIFHDFPEENNEIQFAYGEKEIMTCIIYSTLHWSYSGQMKV